MPKMEKEEMMKRLQPIAEGLNGRLESIAIRLYLILTSQYDNLECKYSVSWDANNIFFSFNRPPSPYSGKVLMTDDYDIEAFTFKVSDSDADIIEEFQNGIIPQVDSFLAKALSKEYDKSIRLAYLTPFMHDIWRMFYDTDPPKLMDSFTYYTSNQENLSFTVQPNKKFTVTIMGLEQPELFNLVKMFIEKFDVQRKITPKVSPASKLADFFKKIPKDSAIS